MCNVCVLKLSLVLYYKLYSCNIYEKKRKAQAILNEKHIYNIYNGVDLN